MNDVERQKKQLRERYNRLRNALSAEQHRRLSAAIHQQLFRLKEWEQTDTIATYISVGNEVDTYAVLNEAWQSGKKVFAPRVDTRNMHLHFVHIHTMDNLHPGAYGIPEPELRSDAGLNAAVLRGSENTLMLVPGLLFDQEGYRIGYGGGFYDRFLRQPGHHRYLKIGLAFSFQLCAEQLPVEKHDLSVDMLITERTVLDCGPKR